MNSPERTVCHACRLGATCGGVVPGVGPEDPILVFCAEAPGEQEDRFGEPLIGKSGEVFDDVLTLAEVPRPRVHVTNVIKCRPEGNRTPRADEIRTCRTQYLQGEIERFKHVPWILMGGIAVLHVGGRGGGVRKNLGCHWHNPEGLLCYATWHPAAVLRGMGRTDQIAEIVVRALNKARTAKLDAVVRQTISCDTETTGLDMWRRARPFLGTVCDGKKAGLYDFASGADRWRLRRLLDRADVIPMQNAIFDIVMLAKKGIPVDVSKVEDVRWSAALADSGDCPYALEVLGNRYFDKGAAGKRTMAAYLKEHKTNLSEGYKDIPREILEPYAIEDAMLTWALYEHPTLKAARETYRAAYAQEKALLPVVMRMEERGMKIDADRLPAAKRALEDRRDELLHELRADEVIQGIKADFNPSSHLDVTAVMEAYGLQSPERTATGNPSWSRKVLEQMVHPVAERIVEYRSIRALASGALNNLRNVMDRHGIVRASYDTVGTEAGRFRASTRSDQKGEKINMVGVPRLKTVRSVFVAREGYVWAKFDMSQIQQRAVAHYTGDSGLVEGYKNDPDADFYRLGGWLAYDRDIDDEERLLLKTTVLARDFGAGVKKLAKLLNKSLAWTEEFTTRLDAAMPGVREFVKEARGILQRNRGVVVVENWPSRMDPRVAYQLLNRMAQVGEQINMKRLMIELDEMTRETDEAFLIHMNHDELDFEIREDVVEKWAPLIVNTMESGWNWKVPVRATAEVGPSWGETEKKAVDRAKGVLV